MSIITKWYKFTYYKFRENSYDAHIIFKICRISLAYSFQCDWMANAPGLKNSQFPTGQTQDLFWEKNLGASDIRWLVIDTLLSYERILEYLLHL